MMCSARFGIALEGNEGKTVTYNQLEVTNAIRTFAEASPYLSMSYYGPLVKASAFLDIKKQSSSVGHGTVPPLCCLLLGPRPLPSGNTVQWKGSKKL